MSLPRYPKYKDSGVEWLGQVPEHWEIKAIKHVVEMRSGEAITSESIAEEGSYPVFGGNGLRGYTTHFTHEGTFALVGRQGALCGNVNYASGKFWASEHAVVCSPRRPVATRWLGELLRALNLGQYSVAAAQPGLSVELVGRVQVPVPTSPEQSAIATFLEHETAKIDALVAEQERLVELLKEKRQSLISHAVTKGTNPKAPMKDSRIDWLGAVPSSWEVVGLTKYLTSVVDYRGRTPTKVTEGIFLVTARNIRDGSVNYSISEEYIDPREYESTMRRGKPEVGDVLFTTEAPLGQVANVDRTDVALAQRVIKFRGQSGVLNNYFLKYWMMGSFSQADMERLATGSTALGIKGSKVVQLRLCLPPINEQAQIVEYIDAGLSRLDALTGEAQQAIDLLQERRTALISAAVTGQVDVREAAGRAA